MPTNSFPIQLPDIIIGTYRIIQLPIIPIVPLPIKSTKYKNVKSKYMDLGPLVDNWNRYKLKYDEIHGEGAYTEAYYLEPIYGLAEDFSDTESDYDKDAYDSYEEYETY